jgi:hypothetical protein
MVWPVDYIVISKNRLSNPAADKSNADLCMIDRHKKNLPTGADRLKRQLKCRIID